MMSLPSSYRYRKTKRTRMNYLVECLSPKIVALRRLLISPESEASIGGCFGMWTEQHRKTYERHDGWRMGTIDATDSSGQARRAAHNIREAINAIPQFSEGWTAECELGTIAFGFARRHGV